ncbi:SigE family RNA polymerase sigma factor [Nocardioides aestuarii]|uniref:SigE family RNA polymerase sigma factor n=1 Tax=Nocardioides aestuarii TaxID=252231 RepID=A0ABW4TP02_9ACTN
MDAREAEFNDFVASRSGALLRTAYLLTGDHHHAEDLLQVALVEAARRWEKLDEPEAYVRRVLYTRNISRWRKRHLDEVSLLDHDRPASSAADHDLRLTLEQALARLTVKQRTILVLRYFEDLTEEQTGRALGISRGTVKSVTRQAFERLRTRAPELADLIGAHA